ncbi:MAG: extracellular solute-binding protein [Spirochaetaceae bacterium]|nr:MAG: extracellular solute-binding protein [Spirochaetaceae bacterium]
MRKWAFQLAVATALLALPITVFAAGAQQPATSPALEDIGFRPSGYPIVDTPVTMEAIIVRPGHVATPYRDMTLLNELQAKTNVRIAWEELPEAQVAERVNLMFASREFPDVFFRADGGHDETNVYTAARGGDVYALNDYLEAYAPNWMRAFDDYPLVRTAITFPDGNIYSLPYLRDFPADYMIRDIQLLNVDWLQNVGKPMPATLDEFRDVLRAFRRGIDDGTLPARAVPWYFRFRQRVGGEFEIYGSFGLYTFDDNFLSLNDRIVEFAAVDPRMADAVEYLHGMYRERLFPEEAFTDAWDDYISKIRSDPPVAGSFGSYHNPGSLAHYFDAVPPLPAPGVSRPVFRSQPIRFQRNMFTVMKRFAYPEVAVRFIDEFAVPETALQMSYGRIGHEIVREGDMLRVLAVADDYTQHAPHNYIAAFIPRSISDFVLWDGDLARRDGYVRDVYEPYVWPQERHMPRVVYTDDEREELGILWTEINNYITSTHADWIVNGGARAGWAAYIRQLENLGYRRMLEIHQAAVDRFFVD